MSYDNGRDGFEVEGDDNVLSFNLANFNDGIGIYMESDSPSNPEETAEGNTISSNTALSNFVDLRDDLPDCGTNTWSDNTFNTSSPPQPSCIQ
jgi:hypothetical protein